MGDQLLDRVPLEAADMGGRDLKIYPREATTSANPTSAAVSASVVLHTVVFLKEELGGTVQVGVHHDVAARRRPRGGLRMRC